MIPMLILALLVSFLDWVAVARNWKKVEYAAKPAVMVLLIGGLAITGLHVLPLIFFSAGIFFSLLGDVFLMLPSQSDSNRWFTLGLGAFLLAHLAYIAGLNIPPLDVSLFTAILIAVVLAITAARLLRRIVNGVLQQGHRSLVLPVEIYGVAITLMLLSAFLTLFSPHWGSTTAVLVGLGAMLFYMSDVILATDRFVGAIKNGRLINMVLYHLGQIALVWGIILQYGK